MDLVKYEMEIPKESKEIVDAMMGLVQHFMDKRPLEEITLLLPSMMAAFDGYSEVKEEMKSENRDELAGYLIHKALPALMPVKKEEDKPEGVA